MGKVETFRHGDKQHKITVRLNDEIYKFILEKSERVGTWPSEFVRMVLTSAYYSFRDEARDEDEQTHIYDQL